MRVRCARAARVYNYGPMQRRLSLGSSVCLLGLVFQASAVGNAHAGDAPLHPLDPYEVLDRLGHALEIVERNYYAVPDRTRLTAGALRGMVGDLDPHSVYFDPGDLKIFEGDSSGQFGGIGVEVDIEDGEAIVIAPVPDSPADRAGIVVGDVIMALNGTPLAELKPEEVIRSMRGEVGSKLTLTVRTKGERPRLVTLIREHIRVSSVRLAALRHRVVYLRIRSFQEGTHGELTDALAGYRRENGREAALILDLRNNPGGLVREATAVANEFLSRGLIFETRHRDQVETSAYARPGGAFTSGKLIVLVNEYSASAAELVAAALKDNGRAILVGARTFGKGSVQTIIPLSHRSALKLTTALYYGPSGETLQARGVLPDHPVESGGTRVRLVVREQNLTGHLEGSPDANAETPELSLGAPITNDELHNGVIRKVPDDPRGGPDRALALAFELASSPDPKQPQP